MSGGHFNFQQFHINEIHDEIENIIKNNHDTEEDEFGYPRGRGYPDDIIESFEEAVRVLAFAAVYAQRIDWLLSGDDGEESYRERLAEELGEIEK